MGPFLIVFRSEDADEPVRGDACSNQGPQIHVGFLWVQKTLSLWIVKMMGTLGPAHQLRAPPTGLEGWRDLCKQLHCCLPTPSHTGDCHPVQPGELGALQCKAFGILVTVSFFFLKKKLFTYLTATGLHCGCRFFSCGMQLLGCSMWNLVPWPGIELRPPALRAWSLSHWTTRKVP